MAGAGGSAVLGHPLLHNEFKASSRLHEILSQTCFLPHLCEIHNSMGFTDLYFQDFSKYYMGSNPSKPPETQSFCLTAAILPSESPPILCVDPVHSAVCINHCCVVFHVGR